MNWIYNDLVEATVREFCEKQVPDAHGLEDLRYSIDSIGGVSPDHSNFYRVEVDIPTSDMDAWLTFVVDLNEGHGEPIARDISCIRSGRGDNSGNTYVWRESVGEWESADSE